MKRVFSFVAALAMAAASLISCQEKIENSESASKHSVHFTVNLGEATKTVLDGTTVNWIDDDASLFHVFENGVEATGDDLLVEFTNGIATVTAVFEDTDAAEFTYTAFVASLNTNSKPVVLKTQTPTATSFDPAADVLIAKPITLSEPNQETDLMFQFARPVSINKMTLVGINAEETIQKVVLEGNKSLGGSYDPSKDYQYAASDRLLTIITSSNVVYFVTAAVNEVTPTITVTTDKAVYSKAFAKAITFTANELHSFSVSFSESDRHTDNAEYGLVTNVNDLSAGDVIVLGCAEKGQAAGAFGGNKYFSAQDATISEEGILKCATAVEITLGKVGDYWTLTTEEGKIGATAAKTLLLNSGTDTWDISFAEESAIISSTDNSCGSILYNASSPRFLNYASGQTPIEIYKKGFTPSAPTKYSITIDNSILNGSVTANSMTAIEGETVTLTATPDTGYEFESWNVTGATVADATNSTTTFTMPAADVAVSASFKKVQTPVYSSLAELVESETPTEEGSLVTVTLTDEKIVDINVTGQGFRNGVYFQVGEKKIEIYCKDVPESWSVGGTVSGTLTDCKWTIFYGTWELCPDDYSELTYHEPPFENGYKYVNEGSTATTDGITVTGNVNTTAANGNPGNSFACTTANNTTFTFSGFNLADYSSRSMSMDVKFSYPYTVTTYPKVTVILSKNGTDIYTNDTTIAPSSKVTSYQPYDLTDLPDFDKITLVVTPGTGKSKNGNATTTYGIYIDNVTVEAK